MTSVGFVLVLVMLLAGCGGKAQVTGKVTFDDGAPLTNGEVRFEAGNYLATGKIQSDGSYRLSSVGENDGVVNGSYKVSVVAMEEIVTDPNKLPAEQKAAKPLVAEKFRSGETSGLTCEVKGTTTFDFQIEHAK
ncbi:MAG: hypothetical protein LBN39_04015 [Planctomycetaceae bacterium]|jgi:hypothetical protein|nr:hypothetical protein [Planctomycetaceae bacterium]